MTDAHKLEDDGNTSLCLHSRVNIYTNTLCASRTGVMCYFFFTLVFLLINHSVGSSSLSADVVTKQIFFFTCLGLYEMWMSHALPNSHAYKTSTGSIITL